MIVEKPFTGFYGSPEHYDKQQMLAGVVEEVRRLRDAVRNARIHGYAFTDQELEIGLRSIAIPVVDSRGAVVAAMSASASTARVSIQQMVKSFVPVLRANADALGRAL